VELRIIALAFGILCHSAFAAGVGLMMYSLFFGLNTNVFSLEGNIAVAWNLFLVVHFPFLHSYFLSSHGRALLARLVPKQIRSEMGTTLFALVASLQLILVFGTWAGSGHVLWQPTTLISWSLFSLAYATSWLLLLKSMRDAGLGVQMGYLGWWSVFRGKKPVYKPFSQTGLNAYSRNPIYVSFSLILWTSPTWTFDRLVITSIWTIYCILGPIFKERRYIKFYGDAYEEYQGKVPYWLPRRPIQNSSALKREITP
jgi:protein-S-isoprenylcysteine O-methyltransferase Ste14